MRRILPFALLAVLALTACGVAAPPAPAYPTELPVVPAEPGARVEAGVWGAVGHVPTTGEPVLYALRITDVTAGERGSLADVAGAEDVDTAVPYSVSYAWTMLSGDEWVEPVALLRGTEEVLGGDVVTVAHDDALGDCATPPRVDREALLGAEQYGCIVVAGAGSTPNALAFTSGDGAPPVLFLFP